MQNLKKGCVFGHVDKFWKEHDRKIKKNACKNVYLGSFFIPETYVIRVLFVSPWTSLIPLLPFEWPPQDSYHCEIFLECETKGCTPLKTISLFKYRYVYYVRFLSLAND